MSPALGMATDVRLLSALAASGAGWVNRDGRVIVKGTTWQSEALWALPETAALVAAQLRFGQERSFEYADEYAYPDDHTEEDIAAVEPDMNDLLDPEFDRRLNEAGWLRVELCRDRNVGTMGTGLKGPSLELYAAPLVAIADKLRCRILSGTVQGENRLLYDSAETEGLPFAPGIVAFQQGPAEAPMPRWPRNAVHERDEDCGDTVGFGM
ncbi:hypothetical protein MOTC310_31690 [Methylobacterium oryzae]|uniref:Uncharacterized protein n=2 Tax=Methylobacterium oryzae TaxID=334852 RepID=A0ABU7TYK5_9HYPH